MLARIKLAWWREALERLDSAPPPAEPRLQAVATLLLPRGVTGAELAQLEKGWAALLDDPVEAGVVAERGERLFAIAGRLIGSDDPRIADAGAVYALTSVGRRGVTSLLEAARMALAPLRKHRFAVPLRPLTLLARAAARDVGGPPFELEASPRRLLAMLAHRWSGKVAGDN